MQPSDPLEITQLQHGTKLQKGEVWTVLWATEAEPATRAFGQAITLARIVFGPRWRTALGQNLTEPEFETLLHEIVFEWLYTCAINGRPAKVTSADLAHLNARRKVRSAVRRALGAETEAAHRLAAHLLGEPLADYEWWLEQEAQMDAVR